MNETIPWCPVDKPGPTGRPGAQGQAWDPYPRWMAIRLVSWNVNGIRAVQRKGLYDPFIAALDPDVVCLQEVKADQSQADCATDGFDVHWHPAIKKGYSGTAMFSKLEPVSVTRGLPSRLVRTHRLEEDDFGNTNDEGRIITAEFESFFLVNVYTPNVKSDLSRLGVRHEQWDPAFLAYVKSLKRKKPVAICGDLNVATRPRRPRKPEGNEGKAGYTEEERLGIREAFSRWGASSTASGPSSRATATTPGGRISSRRRVSGRRAGGSTSSSSRRPRTTGGGGRDPSGIKGSHHCPVSITLDLPG